MLWYIKQFALFSSLPYFAHLLQLENMESKESCLGLRTGLMGFGGLFCLWHKLTKNAHNKKATLFLQFNKKKTLFSSKINFKNFMFVKIFHWKKKSDILRTSIFLRINYRRTRLGKDKKKSGGKPGIFTISALFRRF